MKKLSVVLRVFAAFAIVTGISDLLAGPGVLVSSGAHLDPGSAADPLVDSQIRFMGAIWAGYGAALWWTAGDLIGRMPVLRLLAATLFLGGIGRSLSALRIGAAPPILLALIAIELVEPPLVFAATASRRRTRART
jgi:Domain of unknown function (DUF4345)